MKKQEIVIPVRLDAPTFRRYCAFDAFRRRRLWFVPVMAAMVLFTVALAGLLKRIPLDETLSGVLAGLAILIPLMAFGLYCIQIEVQIAQSGLKDAPTVYTLALSPEGVRVSNTGEPVTLPWESLWAAFRRRDAIYLYARPERAFILPKKDQTPVDEAWSMICRYMPKERCFEGK